MNDRRRVVVEHRSYGCDTGCCGHVVLVDDEQVGRFDFMHGGEDDPVGYARDVCEHELGAEHCADLDWANCVLIGGGCY